MVAKHIVSYIINDNVLRRIDEIVHNNSKTEINWTKT